MAMLRTKKSKLSSRQGSTCTSVCVQTPVLRSTGDIVTGDDFYTQAIIALGALPALLSLLSSPDADLRAEACWTVSNITAGSSTQIQAVIDAKIIPSLIDIMQKSDIKSKSEACWAISNAISGAVHEQIGYIIQQGCIRPLCDLLSNDYANKVALNALESILKAGEGDTANPDLSVINRHAAMFENDLIHSTSDSIMEKYFLEISKCLAS